MREFLDRLGESNVLAPRSFDLHMYRTWAKKAGEEYQYQLLRHYVPTKRDSSPTVLRASKMGKLVFDLAYEMLHPEETFEVHQSERQTNLFFEGNAFEVWLEFALKRMGYRIVAAEHPITWEGISGHVDFIVEDYTGTFWVVEAKSVSERFFKFLEKYDGIMTNDSVSQQLQDRGYLTQLAIYCEAVKMPGALIYKNKNTSEIGMLEITDDMAIPRLKLASKKLRVLRGREPISALFDEFRIPAPELEIYQKTISRWGDGLPRVYPHYAIQYPQFIYKLVDGETNYGNPRKYVVGYRYPSSHVDKHPTLDEDFENV